MTWQFGHGSCFPVPRLLAIALCVVPLSAVTGSGSARAQATDAPVSRETAPAPPPAGPVPPEVIVPAPRTEGQTLSTDSTARTEVIRPPAGIDPGIQAIPPASASGSLVVIPPPGTPGGDPRVQPK